MALAIGLDDRPHIAFTDHGRFIYDLRSESGWELEDVSTSLDDSLGLLVLLAMDGDSAPHLTWFEVTSPSSLNGEVIYAARS